MNASAVGESVRKARDDAIATRHNIVALQHGKRNRFTTDRGGERAAAMFTLIETAKLNGIDPQAWLADVLGRIDDHQFARLGELLPWNWKAKPAQAVTA